MKLKAIRRSGRDRAAAVINQRAFTTGSRVEFLFAFVLLFSGAAGAEPHWASLARQVGQNESTRAAALQELNRMDKRDELLMEALEGPHRALALDGIAAIQAKHLIPELLAKVSSDDDGFLTLCLNALIDNKNKDQVLAAYKKGLASKKQKSLSPGALVAMLEPLGRLGVELPRSALGSLFKHRFPEVRQGALSYLRAMILHHEAGQFTPFLAVALKDPSYQMRLQAYSLAGELQGHSEPVLSLKQERMIRRVCQRERQTFIRKACGEFLGGEN